ncbi:MAG: TetR/AcrR family transcriptional regulator [Actinomycetaceae bacterium]|nr:TetR/AcrR family transcriptional regulator [Actinomycetaceae bacterium]
MRERSHDLRVVKTIDAIQSAFRALVLEKGFSAVTVKELCERARINKKTFYRYYPAIEYLLAEVQAQYSQPYIASIAGLSFPADTERITRTFLEFSAAQDSFYEAITVSTAHEAIRRHMILEVKQTTGLGEAPPAGWDPGTWGIYLDFVTTAPLRVYRAWITGGKQLPAQQMVTLGVALVMNGASALQQATAR